MESVETTLKPDEYRCAVCEGVFSFGWSDKEAEAELAKKFPGFAKEDCELVCDGCFKQMGLDND